MCLLTIRYGFSSNKMNESTNKGICNMCQNQLFDIFPFNLKEGARVYFSLVIYKSNKLINVLFTITAEINHSPKDCYSLLVTKYKLISNSISF